ncbi:MAG: MFS transporter, partial [Elusimicrobia bacterium]|nr:MFS transporter [Elusimicrobiota bacterium]
DEDRNRQFWIYTAGQGLLMLGVNFHYTALPSLVAPTKADSAKIGYNRAINWGSQAASSLVTGPIIDRTSTQGAIIWTNLIRSGLMFLVPILFFRGHLGFAVFATLIAAAGFAQMANMTAGAVAFNRILAGDEGHYNRANAVSTVVLNVAGVIGPLLAGSFIALVDARMGPLAGNAMAYAVYGLTLLACAVGYAFFLRLPRDEMMAARRGLDARLKREGVGPVRYAGVAAGRMGDRSVLLVEVAGDPAAAVVPAEFEGFPVMAVARRRAFSEVVEGFRVIWSDRFLRLSLILTTLAVMSGDALLFAALPRFIEDVLKGGAGSMGLFFAATALGAGVGSGLMAFARDPEQMALAPAARAFRGSLAAREPGLDGDALEAAAESLRAAAPAVFARYRASWGSDPSPRSTSGLAEDVVADAARGLGRALGRSEADAAAILEATGASRDARAWCERRGAKLLARARAEALKGMDHLQRQGRWTSWARGLSWLAYAGLFFAGSVRGAAALLLVSALLGAPALVAWGSLTTKVVRGSYPESQARIYSALFFYQLVVSIVGVLFYGWMMALLPTMTVLTMAGQVLVVCALLDFLAPAVVFPIKRRP